LIADKAGREGIIQEQATPDYVNAELKKLVENSACREEMLLEYDSVYKSGYRFSL